MGALTAGCCEEKETYRKNQLTACSHQTPSKMAVADSKNRAFDLTNISSVQSIPPSQTYHQIEGKQEPGDHFRSQILKLFPVEKKCMSICDFDIMGELGSGNFGKVFQVQLSHHQLGEQGQTYALKRINREQFENKQVQECIKLQKEILMSVNHPFLTKLKFSFADQHFIYLVMECASGGSVESLLVMKTYQTSKKNQRGRMFRQLGDKGIRFIVASVVLGLEELHRNNIMYRDLKPENVLIFEDGYVKLADFGLARLLGEDGKANTAAGTIHYFAPEVVLRLGYTKLVDFWTLGIFIYEIATSESPFRPDQILTRSTFKEKVEKAEKDRDWKNFELSQPLKDLINSLLKFNPEERLGAGGFDEIKSHCFFKDFNWTSLLEKTMPSPIFHIIRAYPQKIAELKDRLILKKTISEDFADEEWNYDYLKSAKSESLIQ